ncbi:MBL fold metallo-hydrolase [Bradyrhizobium sp. B097]|uniref:MBL fold metallo-hydrolase n=1 Tax=Bradyrhizobium sp. B097 TaxID=3140244 RepID=UPI0031830DE7
MSIQSWQIGDVKVTKILESEGPSPYPMIPEATPEAVLPMKWMPPGLLTETGDLILSFHALLVETGNLKIVVDTCVGNDKQRGEIPGMHMRHGHFLETFEKIGCRREEVDIVLCTHLHVDHVGWNTMLVDGKWQPTFPRARYLFGRTEYEHWIKEADSTGESFEKLIVRNLVADSVRPIVEAGLADFIGTDHVISPEIRLLSTPGHSPGHTSVEISSGGQRGFITGDIMHHPCQLAHPEWRTVVDYDIEQGVATRKLFCEEVADSEALVIGTHWAGPTAGQVVRNGTTYRLRTAE